MVCCTELYWLLWKIDFFFLSSFIRSTWCFIANSSKCACAYVRMLLYHCLIFDGGGRHVISVGIIAFGKLSNKQLGKRCHKRKAIFFFSFRFRATSVLLICAPTTHTLLPGLPSTFSVFNDEILHFRFSFYFSQLIGYDKEVYGENVFAHQPKKSKKKKKTPYVE